MGDPLIAADVERIENGLRLARAPVPGTGGDWSYTVPGPYPFEVVQVTAKLTTSGVTANRFARLELRDSDDVLVGVPPPGYMTANFSYEVTWLPGLGYADLVSSIAGPFAVLVGTPQLVLDPGQTLAARTAGISPGDAWGATTITYRRLRSLEPAPTDRELARVGGAGMIGAERLAAVARGVNGDH